MSRAGQGDAVHAEEQSVPPEGERGRVDDLIQEAEQVARRRRFLHVLILVPLTLWLLLRLDWLAAVRPDGRLVDPMLTSGMFTAFVGLWLSLFVEGGFIHTMRRLQGDHIIGLDAERACRVQLHLERLAEWVQYIAGLGICIVIVVGYKLVESFADKSFGMEFTIGSALLGAAVGARLGIMGVYGRLGSQFRHYKVPLLLVPGHPDEAGGSAPIGRFILLQGLLLAIVIIWLTAWLVLLSLEVDFPRDYSFWAGYFRILWLIGAGFFCAGFIWPMLQFRGLMRQAKEVIEAHVADTLKAEIEELHRKRIAASDPAEFLRLNEELGEALRRRRQIEALPTVPLSHLGRRLFSIGAVGPFLTAFGNFVFSDDGLRAIFGSVLKFLQHLFGS